MTQNRPVRNAVSRLIRAEDILIGTPALPTISQGEGRLQNMPDGWISRHLGKVSATSQLPVSLPHKTKQANHTTLSSLTLPKKSLLPTPTLSIISDSSVII